MPDTLAVLRERRKRQHEKHLSFQENIRRAAIALGFIFSVLLAFSILAVAWVWSEITRDLPSLETLAVLLDPQEGELLQPTRLYDRSGEKLIAVLAPSDAPRNYIPLQDFPAYLRLAAISYHDPNFENHPGYTLEKLGDPFAHPTLAQQLAADLLLWDEPPSLRRAIRERILAAQITSRYGRDQVLEWYLNSADFGHYAYGADAAAHLYFGRPASQLTLSETALLSGIANAPELNPMDDPEAAFQAQKSVLDSLFFKGWITFDEASSAPPAFDDLQAPPPAPDLAPAFSELALSLLDGQFNRERIQRGGLNIITTLDLPLQLQAACAARAQVSRLQGLPGDAPAADGSDCLSALDLPPLPAGVSAIDPAAALVVIDPRTGEVLALTGEVDANGLQTTSTRHRAGTMLQPFIYFTAIARQAFSPASTVWDIPGGLSGQVDIESASDTSFKGPLRLRQALAGGLLTPAVELLNTLGSDQVARTARPFGLPVAADESLAALRNGEVLVSPLDLARAFGIFANQGVLAGQKLNESIAPQAILKVETIGHASWVENKTPQAQAITTPQLSYLMNDMLSDPSAREYMPGVPAALDLNRPLAALSGQTVDGGDTWTAGYTPGRAVTTWVGAKEAVPLAASQGLWRAITRAALQGSAPEDWSVPPGITEVDVCDPSGLLPTNACPLVVSEVFLDENRPFQYDDLYHSFAINRETDLLATVFTPSELVEERVYMVVPEQARSWANSVGLINPPDTYDTVQVEKPDPYVQISSPEIFEEVSGQVDVVGTAAGEDFLFYRVLYGEGLNPRRWLTLTDKQTSPVENGRLASWDTSSLAGLYVLQLQVVYQDQTVRNAMSVVTVKNEMNSK